MHPVRMLLAAALLACPAVVLAAPPATKPAATAVVHHVPAVPAEIRDADCFASSIASPGTPYAWRCGVGNAIYDPCLTATDSKTLVCGVPDKAFGVRPANPLPKPEGQNLPATPWRLDLPGGVLCTPFTGTLPPIAETARYGCSDESVILGEPTPDILWKARKAFLEPAARTKDTDLPYRIVREEKVDVIKVWFTGDPTKTRP